MRRGACWRSPWCWTAFRARKRRSSAGWTGRPCDWVHRYNAEGLAGLSNRKPPGRKPCLNSEELAKLSQWVEEGPELARDGVVRWRRIDLRDRLAGEFAVYYHPRTVGKLLDKQGFSHISARPRHPKSDPEAQEAFKKTSRNCCSNRFPARPVTSLSRFGFRMKRASASKAG